MSKNISRRNFVEVAGLGGAAALLAGCSSGAGSSSSSDSSSNSKASADKAADTVVYGKIYTSNSSQEYVTALAVKDGKYVYVGDEDGVADYIKDGTTTVVDYRDKGLVMAGATEGHGHYVGAGALAYMNLTVTGATEDEVVANVKQYVADHPDNEVYFTFGWDNVAMNQSKFTFQMLEKLDEICSDKVMLILDNSGHNGFFNSKCAEAAGVTKDTEVAGGVYTKNDAGELTGLASDMALNYLIKYAVSPYTLVAEKDYEGVAQAMEKALHAYGYTNYMDGWTNYWGTQFLDALSTYDKKSGLHVMISGTYKIDSYDDWKTEVSKAEECMKKYPTDHFKYQTLKLFADGEAVESKSGWLIDGYVDGSHGTQVWETETMNAIVKAANEVGLAVHVHSQGDGATQQVVDACIAAESVKKDGVFNGICHGRNYTEETKKKMGEHGIYAAQNINWRVLTPKANEALITESLSMDYFNAGYPIKSLIDNDVLVASSTDVPSASGAPCDVCGIMEAAVNDTRGDMEVVQEDPSERVDIVTAMDIMTINGAKVLQVEDERGSIEVGKYADFLLINKDITTCDPDKIHEGQVESVYFEGNEVYTA
jgi:predicted amidohydrolase YtcJ